MRLKNTSRYPLDEVKRLVEFAMRGINTTGVAVHVRNNNRSAYAGCAYQQVPRCSPRAIQATVDYLVTIRIGSVDRFPCSNWIEEKGHAYGGKRSPRIDHASWQEGLVAVTAHEARHIQQFRLKKRISEVDCEKFAAARLDAYRQERP